MVDSSIKWSKEGQNWLSELQQQADEGVQNITRQVNEQMIGQPENSIFKVLRDRISQAGFEPDDTNIRAVAKAISERNLK
jgi:hypothetical protein